MKASMKWNGWIAALATLLTLCWGCKSEPTVDEIEGWVRAGNFTKLRDFTADTENPVELRMAAVEKLIEYDLPTELQSVLENLGSDRDTFVKSISEKLLAKLKGEPTEATVDAKSAVFVLLPYLKPEQQDAALKAVADWAFAGIDENTEKAALVRHIEQLDMIGQLSRMKQHGTRVASYLLSYGVETQSLTNYVAESATTPELQRVAIKSFRKLFAIEGLVVPWSILEVASQMRIPEAVDFLVDVYLNESFPESARSTALAAAQDLIYRRSRTDEPAASVFDTAEDKAIVVKALTKLLKSDLATDRWDAADMLFDVAGAETLDAVIGGMKADLRSYARFTPDDEIEMPDYVIIEMCTKLQPNKATVRPVLEKWLSSGDRVQKAISILCLKALGSTESKAKLTAMAEQTDSLEYLFFTNEEYAKRKPLLDAEKIPAMTVGLLAKNAVDGIDMLAAIEKQKADGKLSEEHAKLKRVSALSVIAFTGENYLKAVERSFARKKERAEGKAGKDEPNSGTEDPSDDGTGGASDGEKPADGQDAGKKPDDKAAPEKKSK